MAVISFSYCTTCRARLSDLQKTLPNNLKHLEHDDHVVVLDYNSPDGLWEWLRSSFSSDLASGRLRIFRERTATRFMRCHAKNIAHLLGTNPVLVNLDADNLLKPGYTKALRAIDWTSTAMVNPDSGGGGHRGRVAVRADIFRKLGGHDESFVHGYGYEEIDLFLRARAMRLRWREVHVHPGDALPTPPAMKAATQLDAEGAAKDPVTSLLQSNKQHTHMSHTNLRRGKLVANAGRVWGEAVVETCDGATVPVGFRNP